MRNSNDHLTLRCYLYPEDGEVVAECIDLDIVVIRQTAPEAKQALTEAIIGYIDTAVEGAESEMERTHRVKGLLPRPSPMSHRMRYHFCRALYQLARSRKRKINFFSCPAPLHASAA